MSDDEPRILAFTARQSDDSGAVLTTERRKYSTCTHQRELHLIESRRIIECADCKQCFEPFDYLWSIGMSRTAKFATLDGVTKKIAAATENLAEIERHEANARSRLKRLLDKIGNVEPEHERA